MPYARNSADNSRIYFEDDGGSGIPVVFLGGFGEPIDLVRDSQLAGSVPADEFRHIYVDHRGHGLSDKPHDPEAYAMAVRAGDAVAVLDELDVGRSHFIGLSWGGPPWFRYRGARTGAGAVAGDRRPATISLAG